MIARLVLWSLADSKTTIEELRRVLRDEVVDAVADIEGLRLKLWVSDELTDRFGALELWDGPVPDDTATYERERALIGKDPEIGEEFALEAAVGGGLSDLGLAFE